MPARFIPINSQTSIRELIPVLNRNFQALDAETSTRTVRQAGGAAITSGRLPNKSYGDLYYDSSVVARIYITGDRGNGKPLLAITKDGYDVLKETSI